MQSRASTPLGNPVRPHRTGGSRLLWPGLSLGTALAFSLALVNASLASERLPRLDNRDTAVMSGASAVVAWISETADNQGIPFLVVDKSNAKVLAFDREGRLLGSAPVPLGLALGDVSPPGIGDRALAAIGPEERITPAGRFVASMGENLNGNGILWINCDTALSLHPVVTARASDLRLQRLSTPTVQDNRISYGCVNVPAEFYKDVIQPAFNGTTGIVYILPEVLSLADVFSWASGLDAPADGDRLSLD